MTESFFTEDIVALKADPSVRALVQSTWRDVDSSGYTRPSDLIQHDGASSAVVRQCFREGQLPPGYVLITFVHPDQGCALVHESALILKDRTLTVGDVVKRQSSDATSGIIVKKSLTCVLEPIYNGLPYHGSEPWDHRPEDNSLRVSSEDIQGLDFEFEDRIIYRGWMGEIEDVFQEISIRLSNGSVVKVHDPGLLECPDYVYSNEFPAHRPSLVYALEQGRKRRNEIQEIERQTGNSNRPTREPLLFYPGQSVLTTKANLRLGHWTIGSYTPSVPPRGIVVDVRTSAIRVDWLADKPYNGYGEEWNERVPVDVIEFPELEEVRLYNRHNLTSTAGKTSNELGSREGSCFVTGDIVKFRDISGAAVKYSEESPNRALHGFFRRIPRLITQGFDMNVLMIKDTSTKVLVQWQDGVITQENGDKLVPYVNVDDHEVWVGEVVSLRSAEEKTDDLIILHEIGVVQSVDAHERIARVKWFDGTEVSVDEDRKSTLFPGSSLGRISNRESSVALFDITAYPALTKHRGDLVVIAPKFMGDSQPAGLFPNGVFSPLTRGDYGQDVFRDDPQDIMSTSQVRWVGEVVDLGLDGLLTVRLGALDEPEDIKVKIERIIQTAIGDDDFDSETDSSYIDWGSTSEDEDEHVPLSESIEYEGGERLDSGAEEDWMTDEETLDYTNGLKDSKAFREGEDPEVDEDLEMRDAPEAEEDLEMKDAPQELSQSTTTEQRHKTAPSESKQNTRSTMIVRPRTLNPATQYGFSALRGMPCQFEILDGYESRNHHFERRLPNLSARFLRRIRKEHSMFENNLPEGIWVRTWGDRLDLLRVLILGPRGTPYELASFLLDFKLEDDFPTRPPLVYFHSWTNGVGRINPNLYEDGKVCLSILGTWDQTTESEAWNPEKSSLLQVIVSLLGLVLVEDPYYNEAGFESLVGSEETIVPARIYREKALCMAKGFIVHALSNKIYTMESVIKWLYMDKEGPRLLQEVVSSADEHLSRRHVRNTTDQEAGREPLSAGAGILLKRFLPFLSGKLAEADAQPSPRETTPDGTPILSVEELQGM